MRYLPLYSPNMNPIEQVFAKLKALPRKACARTREWLWNTIGSLLDSFCPAKCDTTSATAVTATQDENALHGPPPDPVGSLCTKRSMPLSTLLLICISGACQPSLFG